MFHNGTVVDLGWAVFYGACGAAALHPSMTGLARPVTRLRAEVSPVRLIVLMLASLIAPAVLFIESFRFRGSDLSVIAVFSAALYLLVLWRLSDVAASHRRALGRERVVRQAGVSLVAATSADQVAAAVRSATDALLGPATASGDVLLAVRTDGTFRALTQASADPALMSRLAELTETWLPLVTDSAPLLAPVTSLPAQARALVPGSDWMLLCPLTVKDRPSGDPLVGVLAVFDGQRALADLFATLEILAYQVALAVERISLRDEVIRRESEAYFRTLVHDTSDVILMVGDDGRVSYATPSAASIFGDITVEGAYLWDLVADGEHDDLVRTLLNLRAGAGLGSRYVDRQITRRDGVTVQVQLRCSDLRHDPTVAGLVLTLRDVTEQRKLESELKHQAFHDALTGLPNRLLFQDRISQQVAAARRDGMTAGVLFVDVDDFKVVNDTMGHSVGDELLVATAERLSGLIREADTAARLGGDEFALLIGNVADPSAVEAAADRLVRVFSEPFALASGAVLATVTVGVATTEDSADTDELLRHADLALYAAKAAGKRQWRRYQPVLSAGLIKRRELQAALEEAVATLRVHAGLPADRRAHHRGTRRVRGPDPVAASAMGNDAARPVHLPGRRDRPDRAARLLGAGPGRDRHRALAPRPAPRAAAATPGPMAVAVPRKAPFRGPYVSVNVSARQFSAPGFVEGVRRVLDASGLEPACAHARADRERPAAQGRAGAVRPDAAEGHRRSAGDRRLRHRLLLPQLPAGAADRRAEDGQVLRGRDRHLRAAPGARRGHRPDRADAPARGHRRGHRKRAPA